MQKAIAPGAVIERRYQIQKKISDNTCNCCYLAEDSNNSNRLVVLSFPRIELLILPGFASAFKDACENLANARIGGVVKVLDNGLHESQPYAVLPNITDDSLEALFQNEAKAKQKVTLESVLDWAAPLAVSLDELHEADYIHSNVRPSSVYISNQKVLLGDFITEFALQRMGKFKNAISTLDVSEHLAPEYLKSFYTPSYDQYLLATLVYESLAGDAPFSHTNSGDDYRMHVATIIPKPLSDHRPELTEVSEVLVKALSRNPAKRFDSCREFISQLQEVQAVIPVTVSTSSKVVSLKPALRDEPVTQAVETPAEPIITSIRQEKSGAKGKKGLMWLGVLLLGSAAVAYTVISQNGADQITSNSSRETESSGTETNTVPVKIVSDNRQSEIAQKQESQPTDTKIAEVTPAKVQSATVTSAGKSPALDGQLSGTEKTAEAETVDVSANGELKSLIQKEALLAHQALNQSDDASSAAVASVVPEEIGSATSSSDSKSAPVVQDFSGLAAIVNQAVSTGEKDFLETRSRQAEAAVESAEPAVATDGVSGVSPDASQVNTTGNQATENQTTGVDENEAESSKDSEANGNSETGLTLQEEINQELLQAQALVNAREAEARRAAERSAREKIEAEQAKKRAEAAEEVAADEANSTPVADSESTTSSQSATQGSVSVIAVGQQAQSAQIDGAVDSSQTSAVDNEPAATSLQSQAQERQRIRAFKQKETARIKAVTDNCTVGGKIHREAAAGNLSFVKACMAVGVDPNIAQNDRWTLLHIAARSGHLNMSKLLIAKGARVNAKSSGGLTPLDMATAQKKSKVVSYLKTRGGVTTR